MSIITFDTEATSLQPGQVCQLSYIVHNQQEIIGKNFYFKVDAMDEESQEIHGLSLDALMELSNGLRFEDHAEEIFKDFNDAKLLIGHNVSFDDRYLRLELERCNMKLPRKATFCTMNYFTGTMNLKRKVPIGRPKPPRLEELVEFYGFTPEIVQEYTCKLFGEGGAAHDARYDTAATYLCVVEATAKRDLRGVL